MAAKRHRNGCVANQTLALPTSTIGNKHPDLDLLSCIELGTMLSLEDNAVRVSTVALLTLSALAAQNLTQQATANPVTDSVPNQPS